MITAFIRDHVVSIERALWSSVTFGCSLVHWDGPRVVRFIRDSVGGGLRVVAFIRVCVGSRRVHSGSPFRSLGLSSDVSFTRVRAGGRWFHTGRWGS